MLPRVAKDSGLRPDHGGDQLRDQDVGDAAPADGEEDDKYDEKDQWDPAVGAHDLWWKNQLEI